MSFGSDGGIHLWNGVNGRIQLRGPRSWTKYEHGWPLVFMHRTDRFNPNWTGPPWLFLDGWMLLRGEKEFSALKLSADVLLAVLITCWAAFLFETWRRRRRRIGNFSLKDLLVGCLTAAVILAWFSHHYRDDRQEADSLKWFRARPSVEDIDVDYVGPLWLARLVGRGQLGMYWRAVAIDLKSDSTLSKDLLQTVSRLGELSHVKTVTIYAHDASIESVLRDSPALRDIHHIRLASSTRLHEADDVIDALLDLRQLRYLTLDAGAITTEQIERLRHGLPNCTVEEGNHIYLSLPPS